MSTPEKKIILLQPENCSAEQLLAFHQLVHSGGQVDTVGLADRIAAAATLAFAYVDNELAGVASVKQPKRNYILGRFLKAKVPRLADEFRYEIGYAVTAAHFRRQGISRELIAVLLTSLKNEKAYATTKNDAMRNLLNTLGFHKAGSSFKNPAEEILDLYITG